MISVCMATYNGEEYIKEQLESILCQLGEMDEIIISDDGSTDNTLNIIESYNDSRIKIHINTGKHGFVYNFENALQKAKGEYIFLSDQDDIWLPEKINSLIKILHDYWLVCSNAIVVDENLNEINKSFFNEIKAGKGILKNFIKSRYWGFGIAFRKELLELALPFPVQNEMGHDMILGFIADINNKIYFEKTSYTLYRRHSNTVTNIGSNRKSRSLFKIFKGRIITFYYLIFLHIRILIRNKHLQ